MLGRKISLAAAAIAMIAASSLSSGIATAQNALEDARAAGFIRVGFANEAPYGFATPAGVLTGEAPEIAKAILNRLGIPEVDGVLTEFGSLIPGLNAGRFDMVAAGMFVTPSRCEQVSFSEPTYAIGQAFLVPAGNPNGLNDYGDIVANPDTKLAVLAGAVEATDYAPAAGIGEDQLVVLPDPPSMLAAVRSGRADAAALTAASIQNLADSSDEVEMAPPFGDVPGVGNVDGHGAFAFRQEDTSLLDAFNAELANFLGSQEHIDLVGEFGFAGVGFGTLPSKTTANICAGG